MAVAPFYGTNNTPRRVKIGFSVMVAILLFQILERPALDYEGVFGFAVIIIREGITGLLIGFAASVCNSIILLAGNMIDMEIGLSMATEYDPMNIAVADRNGYASLYSACGGGFLQTDSGQWTGV